MYKNYDYGRVPDVVSHLSGLVWWFMFIILHCIFLYNVCIYVWMWHVNKPNFHGILDNKIILFYSILFYSIILYRMVLFKPIWTFTRPPLTLIQIKGYHGCMGLIRYYPFILFPLWKDNFKKVTRWYRRSLNIACLDDRRVRRGVLGRFKHPPLGSEKPRFFVLFCCCLVACQRG